jgi:hypothetical protein
MPAQLFVIWSIEHEAWWRPGWAGYTCKLAEAGRYDQAEADAILARANYVNVNECAIPLTSVGAEAASVPETGALAPGEVMNDQLPDLWFAAGCFAGWLVGCGLVSWLVRWPW